MSKNTENTLDFNGKLEPAADIFLAEAIREFDLKQEALNQNWQFCSYENWKFDPTSGILLLAYSNGKSLLADGQLLGTFSIDDANFEWAWNNPRFPKNLIQKSLEVYEFGVKYKISYLIYEFIPVHDDVFLSYLSAIGIKATKSVGIFRGVGGDVEPFILLNNLRWG